MTITQDFKYFKPKTLSEALDLLDQHKEKAKVLAGGTDLINNIKEDLESPEVLIDIKGINELSNLKFEDNRLHIGANVTFNELIKSEIVQKNIPLIADMSKTVACNGIRNRATIVGNICSAVPSLDSAPLLLVFETMVNIFSKIGKRQIPIQDLFKAPKKTILNANEIVTEIIIPMPEKGYCGCWLKLGRYRGEDLAQAGTAILAMDGNDYRIAFCAIGPIPKRVKNMEAILRGKPISDDLINEVKSLVEKETSPISDIRSSKEYRLHIIKTMLERGLNKLKTQKCSYSEILGG